VMGLFSALRVYRTAYVLSSPLTQGHAMNGNDPAVIPGLSARLAHETRNPRIFLWIAVAL